MISLRASTLGLAASALLCLSQSAPAQTLAADYQLQDVFTSSVGTIGPLAPTGAGNVGFVPGTVNGFSQEVLAVSTSTMTLMQSGVQTQTNPFIDGSNYSIVLLASFDLTTTGILSTKVFDFKSLGSDAGLYLNAATNNLEFVDDTGTPVGTGAPGTATASDYAQIVLTRDGTTDLVSVYETDVMGNTTLAFTFSDLNQLAVLGDGAGAGNDFLTLFQDDGMGAGGAVLNEGSQGNIARLRLYDGVLSASEVAGLTTTIPEPGTWALLAVGAGALGVLARRRA